MHASPNIKIFTGFFGFADLSNSAEPGQVDEICEQLFGRTSQSAELYILSCITHNFKLLISNIATAENQVTRARRDKIKAVLAALNKLLKFKMCKSALNVLDGFIHTHVYWT